MDTRKRLRPLLLILMLLPSLLTGCSSDESEDKEDVTLVSIETGSLVISTLATGNIRPEAKVALSFEMAGRAEQVLVEAGERVEEGQVLAQLDTTDAALQVKRAEAGLHAAQAQWEQVKAGARSEEEAISEAQLRAAQAALTRALAQQEQLEAGSVDADVAAVEAEVASAMAEHRVARDQHDETMRCKTIKLPGGGEKKICPGLGTMEEQARYRLHAANEALEAAQMRLEAVTGGKEGQLRAAKAAVWAAAAERDVAQAQLDLLHAGAAAEEIKIAEAAVEEAQVSLEIARSNLEKCTLKAPFAGVVESVSLSRGEAVSPQMSVVTMVDDSQFKIEADVDESDIEWLAVGQEAEIALDAFPGRQLTGRVTAIAPSASVDGGVVSYRVTVEIAPTDLPLRGGMTADTEIIKERRENVLLAPNRAIWIDAESGKVFVEKMVAGEPVVTFVEQGAANEEWSEVLSGLEQGDELVVRSASVRDRFRSVVTTSMTGNQ